MYNQCDKCGYYHHGTTECITPIKSSEEVDMSPLCHRCGTNHYGPCVNMFTIPNDTANQVSIHIECSCIKCTNSRVTAAIDPSEYGTYAWYRKHCHDLAEAEYEAHEEKRADYCGDSDDAFWMFRDIMESTQLSFEDVWLAWSSRHWQALARAMKQSNYKQAAKRALDLMGWLFLLLAYYKRYNAE